jgi:hypothetical protein
MKRKPAKIKIYIRHKDETKRRFIIIDGVQIIYARWLFEKEVRPLRPGEIVHHKDFNSLNDCIENYEALSKSKHTRIHMLGNRYSKDRVCSKENRRKLGVRNSKRIWTKKSRLKIGISRKDKKASNETRKKLRMATKGENNPSAILTWKKVNEIRYKYFWTKKYRQIDLSIIYGVSRGCINNILQGYKWNPNNLTKEQLRQKSRIQRSPA